jgi:hypothetical protein
VFGFDWDRPLEAAERDELIEKIAAAVTARRMTVPAILLLEGSKPLAFLSSQALVVSSGLLAPLVGAANMQKLAKLMESRENIELLIRRIEHTAPGVTEAGAPRQESNS